MFDTSVSHSALSVLLPFNPLCFHMTYIISYSCHSLRYIHHLWFPQGRVECLCPAGTSLTSHGLRLVLAKPRGLIPGYWSAGTAPGALDPPPGYRGRRQAGQRRAKQKHNLVSPRQTAHLLSTSIWGTIHKQPLYSHSNCCKY